MRQCSQYRFELEERLSHVTSYIFCSEYSEINAVDIDSLF